MSITSANRLELLQIADAVAREKLIDPGLVIEAMEESMAKAAPMPMPLARSWSRTSGLGSSVISIRSV